MCQCTRVIVYEHLRLECVSVYEHLRLECVSVYEHLRLECVSVHVSLCMSTLGWSVSVCMSTLGWSVSVLAVVVVEGGGGGGGGADWLGSSTGPREDPNFFGLHNLYNMGGKTHSLLEGPLGNGRQKPLITLYSLGKHC